MGNPNNSLSSEFQSLLYYKFTFKKEYDKNEAAIFLDKSPDTIQRYCSGRLSIPIDVGRGFIRFVYKKNPKDTELVEFFCLPHFLPIPTVGVKPSSESIRLKEIKLSIINGKTIEEIEKALKDGKVDRNEYKKAHQLLTGLRQIAAELDEVLKKEVRG